MACPLRSPPFNWLWPSTTATHLQDLNPATEAYDPSFSWDPVPGAARYEVEINSSSDFAPGSKVCCNGTSIATSLSPMQALQGQRLLLARPCARPGRQRGRLEPGPVVHQDLRQGRAGRPRHRARASRTCGCATTSSTRAPTMDVVPPATRPTSRSSRWDPVPGASSYEIQVAHMGRLGLRLALTPPTSRRLRCPSWTPLSSPQPMSTPSSGRERSRRTRLSDAAARRPTASGCALAATAPPAQEVWGDYTYLQNGSTDSTGPVGPAFTWTDYPDPTDPTASAPCCLRLSLCARLPGTRRRHDHGTHAALHLEGTLGREQLLRRGRQGRELQQRHRRGVHANPGLRAAQQPRADDVHDETTTFYWAVSAVDATRTEPTRCRSTYRTPPTAPSRSSRRLPA